MNTRVALVTAVGLLLTKISAIAYGPIGHQLVGAIADRRLANTPAGKKVAALLDGFSLEKAAVVADEIKGWDKRGADDPSIFHYSSHPKLDAELREFWKANPPTKDRRSPVPSHHWFHYTDVPVAKVERYGGGTVGRSQWDIVQMINYCSNVLNGSVPEQNDRKITKGVAILLLAHYLGDIHQPLHVGAEYFDSKGNPVSSATSREPLEDQGGNSFTLVLSSRLPITGNANNKLHGFWDNDCVMANLPALPESMPKEERRAAMEEARGKLADRLSSEEPKRWRVPVVDLKGYSVALADEILPIAREAHERLRFRDVHVQQDDGGNTFATGIAEDKPERPTYAEWSRDVVLQELHTAGWRLADVLARLVE